MSAIVINNLSKRQGKIEVLSNFNLEVLDGEIFSLLGMENSGKTTLARIIMGFLKPNKGTVNIYNMDSFKESREIKESTSFVPEESLLQTNMRSSSILKKTLNSHNLQNTEDIDAICDYFNFNDKLRISDLDKRESKIFSIINALITKPRLLVLDNPATNLNQSDIDKVFSYIKGLNERENLTVLILTNSLKEARKYSTRIAYLHDGKVAETEYNNINNCGDKVLKINSYRGNLNYFTSIGAKVIKDADDETILYYDQELPELSKVIYEEGLENYILEDANLEDKISAYYSGNNMSTRTDSKNLNKIEDTLKEESLIKNPITSTNTVIKEESSEDNLKVNSKTEKITLDDDKRDNIHNTKTNLFADEDEYKDNIINGDMTEYENPQKIDTTDYHKEPEVDETVIIKNDLTDKVEDIGSTKNYTDILSSKNVDYAQKNSSENVESTPHDEIKEDQNDF